MATDWSYVRVYVPERPQVVVSEHILIAERALGKPLPPQAQVHHVNGDTKDNRPRNLVVCEDQAYHRLLHLRQRALDEAGDPDLRKCRFCHVYDHPGAMRPVADSGWVHDACKRSYARWRRRTSITLREWRRLYAAHVSPAGAA